MSKVVQNSNIAWILSWLGGKARPIRVKLAVYLLLIGGFWGAFFTFSKGLEYIVPPPASGNKDWLWYAKAIGIGLGFPTGILFLAEGLPALWQWRRDRRLERWRLEGEARRGYFRLTPYERQDRDQFRRADGAQDEVLAWLRRDDGPTIRYLSGRSGAGKSSLLNASVLPNLESGDPKFLTLTLRSFGDPVGDLARALGKPGFVYPDPPRDLPAEILPLLQRIDARLKREGQWLLVLFDQFEEFLIFHDREPEQQHPIRKLLADLDREPPKRIRVLLTLRADYEGDISRLDLPRLRQDENWKQVDAFTEAQAREFLQKGFDGPGLGSELIQQVVRHASELDEVRGKVRPVVLNMIGLALASRSGQAGQVFGSRECQKLMLDHVKEGLKDPLARDHAPKILEQMVTPEGRKQRPASADDLAGTTGLSVKLIQGCLARLNALGFVRPFQSDSRRSAGAQVWEISHDFVARLLSLVLPSWKPSLWTRLRRPLLGPTLVLLGIATVFGIMQYQGAKEGWRLRSLDQWAGKLGGSTQSLGDGTYEVAFRRLRGQPPDLGEALRGDLSEFAHLISSLDLSDNLLTALPPEVGKLTSLTSLNLSGNQLQTLPSDVVKLTRLTSLDLSNEERTTLPPEVFKLTGLTRLDLGNNQLPTLPTEIGNLTRLTILDLRGNQLQTLPSDVVKLTNLTYLDLRSNRLLALPTVVGKMTSLTDLLLSGNLQLPALSAEIGNLTRLTRLDLGGTLLSKLPTEIGNLTRLTSLELSGNQLTTLPHEIGNLTRLTRLNVGNNRLTALPPEVGKLTSLTRLDFPSNQLTTLPPEIGKLTRLTIIDPNYNRLTDPPPEVVKQGLPAILKYFREKLASGPESRTAAGQTGKP